MPQVRVEAADLIMAKVETNNFEGFHYKIEAKDLSIVSVRFKITAIREVHHNRTVLNTAMSISPTFRGIMPIHTEAEAMAVDLSILEDVVVAGPTIRIILEHISISITHMTNNQNNMVLPAVRFNHSPKHCYKGEHDINNIMEKMSINPHQSQQSNLYQ